MALRKIEEKGIANVEDIFLALLEADGKVYISI